MTKTLKNAKMVEMLHRLSPLLTRRDKIGYAAARNYRALSDALTEYVLFRDRLIEKYGEPDKDENGSGLGTVSLKIDSPRFRDFCAEMEPFNEMEHEAELMTIRYEEAIGELTGAEILSVDWMFED